MIKQFVGRWAAGMLISGFMSGAFFLLGLDPYAGFLIGSALTVHGELAATKV